MGTYLEGKSIAITGGGGGIGRAIALACAAGGERGGRRLRRRALDGSNPSSEVADTVVKEIHGGRGHGRGGRRPR